MDGRGDAALLRLLADLAERDYKFVTVTPETHRRVIEREPGRLARDLRDVFGWSLAFKAGLLPPMIGDALVAAEAVSREGDRLRSRIRVASEGERLFLHSAYPTEAADSVFFGPDTYRFAAFLRAEIPRLGRARRLVDIGTGSGVGAIVAAGLLPGARAVATDINPLALRYARINARHAGVALQVVEAPGLAGVEGPVDLVIANPPFVADPAGRLYRDGGGESGAGLSLQWALEAARRLEPGGTMLLYTGSAISEGRDRLHEALESGLGPLGCRLRYVEIDPDIFGDLLDEPAYERIERIAAVGAVISKR